ncbi:MAG: hypothetical protein AAGJ95_07920 [Cyanobacteria bacterium J06554_11]
MKPSHRAESAQSAPTNYAPSVPMSVYRELAAELRANKAVIDSLNSRNQQLIQQNQRLKQEIHNVVQATLTLGQFAGVARPASPEGFPNAVAPDTLAKLVRAQRDSQKDSQREGWGDGQRDGQRDGQSIAQSTTIHEAVAMPPAAEPAVSQPSAKPIAFQPIAQKTSAQAAGTPPRNRMPRSIRSLAAKAGSPTAAGQKQSTKATKATKATRQLTTAEGAKRKGQLSLPVNKPLPKLFTEQSGEYRSSVLEAGEEKEIGGIWLALSIILIIVTAFGAGFLIMKPLLNDR